MFLGHLLECWELEALKTSPEDLCTPGGHPLTQDDEQHCQSYNAFIVGGQIHFHISLRCCHIVVLDHF